MTRSAAARRPVRCAIYTRKSTAEGLEQAFNSLDAQREACTAYVLSQKHEGWTALPQRYDDGGFSGGAMDRPALQRLLEDVRAGRVDAVLVYKVDRLTRALADFARIVAIFEAAQVAFVSVTQAFDTRSPMGKLTLNVLLSFSQFERELAAERIRDKIAASKARGLWMGGMVPIGYRAEARTLTAVPDEAALVRRIFERYLALGSVNRLKAELDAAGIRTPERLHRNGRRSGGAAFSRGKLYGMLANPVFIGRIRHRDLVHPGQHAAIVDPGLWQAVQDRLAANRVSRSLRQAARAPSPLAGRLLDPEGRKMRPSHASSNGRRYRYYVSADLVEGSVATGATGWRIPAAEIEAAVARTLAARLRDPGFLSDALGHAWVTLRHPRLRPGSLPASPSWPIGSMRRDRQRGGKRSGGSSPGSSSRRPGSGRKRASPRRMRRPMAPRVRPWLRCRPSRSRHRCSCSAADRSCASCCRARLRRHPDRTRSSCAR